MRTFVIGGGLTPFMPTGDYKENATKAAAKALENARVDYGNIDAAVCSYCYGSPTCGQAALYELGLTGIPIFNTNNNCSSGASAIYLAAQLLKGGSAEAVLVLGFEEMDETGLAEAFPAKVSPVQRQIDHLYAMGCPADKLSKASTFQDDIIKVFGLAAEEYLEEYHVDPIIFAEIAAKNRMHGQRNPNAMIRKETTPEKIMKAKKLFGPMTVAMAAPTASGAASVILCTEAFTRKHGLPGIELLSHEVVSDLPSSFSTTAPRPRRALAGVDMARRAASSALAKAKVGIDDVELIELHDCFSPYELFLYEALGLCGDGKAAQLWARRKTVRSAGGFPIVKLDNCVVNISGGLASKGHPIGATGVAQCCEILWQMRNEAGERQMVPPPKVSLQHNYGFNGGAVVLVYRKDDTAMSKL
eukprot:GEMP01028848.1.p1 GENE.GEMP01028848.1~~GEMP01028848.1.p1  ORF type:complete len:416 (+),score=102.66 GEMP01028848.1:133-1380(+)